MCRRRSARRPPPRIAASRYGPKLHVLSDTQGIPLAVAVSGANMHDSLALKPLIRGIPAVRSRRGPRRRRPVKLRADKAYFSAEHLAWLHERGLVARIARPGIEFGERLPIDLSECMAATRNWRSAWRSASTTLPMHWLPRGRGRDGVRRVRPGRAARHGTRPVSQDRAAHTRLVQAVMSTTTAALCSSSGRKWNETGPCRQSRRSRPEPSSPAGGHGTAFHWPASSHRRQLTKYNLSGVADTIGRHSGEPGLQFLNYQDQPVPW
ncbi:transposase [Streptomyces lydicamycinicus]|uniref:transposase n=1 Tax=Streptomyces lydicamycinicus TaxID=1546107 RepID=UPI003C2E48E4